MLIFLRATRSNPLTRIFLNFAHQAYLHIQLGTIALGGAHHNEAADHFTATFNTIALLSKSAIYYLYEDLQGGGTLM